MPKIKGRIVEPDEHLPQLVVVVSPARAMVIGAGPFEVACGDCGRLLVQGGTREQLKDMAAQCAGCGAMNDLSVVGG